MNTLADRLRYAMKAANMNQRQLADAVGVKPPSINGWLSEKAKFLRGENLLKASAALGVSDVWLATGKGEVYALGAARPSQAGRLDRDKVMAVAEAMRIVMGRRGRKVDLTESDQADLFVDAYAELTAMRDGSSSMAAGAIVADLLAVREARARERDRNSEAGRNTGKENKS